MLYFFFQISISFKYCQLAFLNSASFFSLSFGSYFSQSCFSFKVLFTSLPQLFIFYVLNWKQVFEGFLGLCFRADALISIQYYQQIIFRMKEFKIGQFLLYNPKMLSSKRKAVQIDIQQAKILAFYPQNSPFEQKCNTVGMAEGVYAFFQELSGTESVAKKQTQSALQPPIIALSQYDNFKKVFQSQCLIDSTSRNQGENHQNIQKSILKEHIVNQNKTEDYLLGKPSAQNIQKNILPLKARPLKPSQFISMNTCCLIQKEVQEDIWLFLKLQYQTQQVFKPFQNSILQLKPSFFDQQLCDKIIDHLYLSFALFHGPVSKFIFLQQHSILQKIISYLIPKYTQIFSTGLSLNTMMYVLPSIRAIPLDVNSTLKFYYFKKVIQSYDPSVQQIMIFAHNMLAFSSLNKCVTEYFVNYLYGTGEPYRFDSKKSRFVQLPGMPTPCLEHFGTLYNSYFLGFQQKDKSTDLVDVSPANELFQAFVPNVTGDTDVYRVNFYYQKDILFMTFYSQKPSASKLIFQNRFYHDNLQKFIVKINEVMGSVLTRKESHTFLFHNCNTFIGKSTIRDWNAINDYVLPSLRLKQQGMVINSTRDGWVYCIRRLSRLLLMIIPDEISLQKIEQYVAKLAKDHLLKAFI